MRTAQVKIPGDAPNWASNLAANIVDFVRNMLRGPFVLTSYTVAKLPDATRYAAALIYVSNETGGAVPAFSDGTNWRRVTDRNIVS